MKTRPALSRSIAGIGLAITFATPALSATATPIVVELFTSQGCSSCPPANANLITVSGRQDVLALSFSVTYWDYLGWKDVYGKKEFTERQRAYVTPLRQASVYTPQMVIDGRIAVIGNRLTDVDAALAAAVLKEGPDITLSAKRVDIGTFESQTPADVWLVRYHPRVQSVTVTRGENGGTVLRHVNVVQQLERLGKWNGEKTSFKLPPPVATLKSAILVQAPNGGPILSALSQ
ncbi:hypothetical protein N185_15730 [Sinorhizobium sp. GW3]|nr:hypothetical protein N185_15730 [Sinorhizobium sp. GW3]